LRGELWRFDGRRDSTSDANVVASSMEFPMAEPYKTYSPSRAVNRYAVAAFFVFAGVNHFRVPDPYRRIVPPGFGPPATLVAVSGVFEILGGLGLLIPRLRRPAAYGLIALLVAVFPANLYMAISNNPQANFGLPAWMRWVRLPLQLPLMWWVWSVSRDRSTGGGSA
jgi:uncharacterized membrane protein